MVWVLVPGSGSAVLSYGGGGSGGGLARVGGVLGSVGVVRSGLAAWVLGTILVLMFWSDSAVPSFAAGGGSGGGLVEGVWIGLGVVGDIQGADRVEFRRE